MPIRSWATNVSEENYKMDLTRLACKRTWFCQNNDSSNSNKSGRTLACSVCCCYLFPNKNPYDVRDAPHLRVSGHILAFFPSKLQQVVSIYTLRTLTSRNNQKWPRGTISVVHPRLLANTLHSSPCPIKNSSNANFFFNDFYVDHF